LPELHLVNSITPTEALVDVLRVKLEAVLSQLLLFLSVPAAFLVAARRRDKDPRRNDDGDGSLNQEEILPALLKSALP
jgi:hypothetical protein